MDLATGAVTAAPWPTRDVWLVGLDARRSRLLVLVSELDTLGTDHVRHRVTLTGRDVDTGASSVPATVVSGEFLDGRPIAGDSTMDRIAGPTVATRQHLIAVGAAPDTSRLAAVDLVTGGVAFDAPVGPWETLIAPGGAVYRTGHTAWSAPGDGPVTSIGRTFLVRERPGAAPDTLAHLATVRWEMGHLLEATYLTRWGDLVAHDRDADRLVFNVNGRFRTVDLATGVVADVAPVPAGLRLAVITESVSVVAGEVPPAVGALRVAPNPARGIVRVTLPVGTTRAEAFTVTGRRVAMLEATAGEAAWDVRGLAPGLYVVRADGGTSVPVTVVR